MPCSDSEFQQWTFYRADEHRGSTEVLDIAAGPEVVSLGWGTGPAPGTIMGGSQCLDVGGGASVNMAPLQMWSCLGNSNQEFDSQILATFPGNGQIMFNPDHEFKDQTCVDVPGGNLVAGQTIWMWQCDDYPVGSDSVQMWELENESPGNSGPGRLFLANFPDWCLERPAEEKDGDLPYIMPCSDSEFQLWTFYRADEDRGVTALQV